MSNTFFISDTHFGHTNCLKFDNRPFLTAKECDEHMIARWNDVVKQDDHVYHLGDVSWLNQQQTADILSRLNGVKHLIAGNHDKNILKSDDLLSYWKDVSNYKEIMVDDKHIILCHYPIVCYKNHFYEGWFHLYGHVHNSFESHMVEHFQMEMRDLYSRRINMYNVGVMMRHMDYTPRTIEEIIRMNT